MEIIAIIPARRQEELAALMSLDLKATLAAAGVRLTDFRELSLQPSGRRQ